MIRYTTSDTRAELEGILTLQKANLPYALSHEEIRSQGFVTVSHTYAQLEGLNNIEKHIIGKDGDNVIAYLLAMTKQSAGDIPVLIPMFEIFNNIIHRGKRVNEYNYIVIGQACVGKDYRGQGVFDEIYKAYRNHFIKKYDFAITEIDSTNERSMRAHERVGFKVVHEYKDGGKNWLVVLWDWDNPQEGNQ
jgi:hypothetical protein